MPLCKMAVRLYAPFGTTCGRLFLDTRWATNSGFEENFWLLCQLKNGEFSTIWALLVLQVGSHEEFLPFDFLLQYSLQLTLLSKLLLLLLSLCWCCKSKFDTLFTILPDSQLVGQLTVKTKRCRIHDNPTILPNQSPLSHKLSFGSSFFKRLLLFDRRPMAKLDVRAGRLWQTTAGFWLGAQQWPPGNEADEADQLAPSHLLFLSKPFAEESSIYWKKKPILGKTTSQLTEDIFGKPWNIFEPPTSKALGSFVFSHLVYVTSAAWFACHHILDMSILWPGNWLWLAGTVFCFLPRPNLSLW